ncbi:MAG: glycosyltransferase family 2 protein [Thermoanaerobaculia bacterium]
MKLIIQIPAYNEEENLGEVLKRIPKKIEGIEEIKVILINDGSQDRTREIAEKEGVDIIIDNSRRLGLARTFMIGIKKALEEGADIIVNIDGDGQYPPEEIPKLIKPILEGKSHLVIGNRSPSKLRHFSLTKRFFQFLGTKVVQFLSQSDVKDATSGFRAFSKEIASKLQVFSNFTYTLETIIQASELGYEISFVDINARETKRKSRLMKSSFEYILKSGFELLRIFVLYNSLKTFIILSLIIAFPGIFFFLRFLYYFIIGDGFGHIQSLIAGAVSLIIAFQTLLLGIISDLISINRKILEELKRK